MDPNSGLNLIGHGPIDYLVVIGMVAMAFWFGLTNPQKILWLLPAATTFYFFIRVVTLLTPIKLVPFFFLLGVAIRGEKGYLRIQNRQWHIWVILLIAFATILGAIYLPTFKLIVPSPHTKTRLIVQLINYVNLVFIYFIVYRETRKAGGLGILFKSYLYTTSFLCLYGVYQWVASQTGLPMRGIVYNEDLVNAALDFENFIFRINSFANEPKRLSYILTISIVIMLSGKGYYRFFFKNKWVYYLVLGLHLICIFWTYSTSIYASIAVFVGLMLLLSIRRVYHRFYYQISLLSLLLVSIVLVSLPLLRERLLLLYELRIESQVSQIDGDVYVRTETDAINFLKLKPYHIPLGVGPGNYNFAFHEALGWNKGVTGVYLYPLNSSLITIIMDFGLMGLLIFCKHIFAQVFTRPRYRSELSRRTVFQVIIMFFCISITLNPLPIYFMFIAAYDADEITDHISVES